MPGTALVKPVKKTRRAPHYSNSFRIIAGRWRGRRLVFPPNQELRPTADRVRETLFNWLQPHIAGAAVLDAFTGSGALALEALSRGAQQVTAWDTSRPAVMALREHAAQLGLAEGQQLHAEAVDALQRLSKATETPSQSFDIVLLDPPFRRNWWPALFAGLQAGWLQPGALLYLEFEQELELPVLPPGWQILRQHKAGQVAALLIGCGGE